MKEYITDSEIEDLGIEIFHFLDDDVCWERSLEDDYDWDNDVNKNTLSIY